MRYDVNCYTLYLFVAWYSSTLEYGVNDKKIREILVLNLKATRIRSRMISASRVPRELKNQLIEVPIQRRTICNALFSVINDDDGNLAWDRTSNDHATVPAAGIRAGQGRGRSMGCAGSARADDACSTVPAVAHDTTPTRLALNYCSASQQVVVIVEKGKTSRTFVPRYTAPKQIVLGYERIDT